MSRRRKLTWRYDEDKAIGLTVWLPPEQGAVVLQALRAWTSDLEHPHDPEGSDPAPTRAERLEEHDNRNEIRWDGENPPWQRDKTPAVDMADAIVGICGDYLSSRAAEASNPDTYQVIIHAGIGAITADARDDDSPARASAETQPVPVTHPADPMRCHIEDGLSLSAATLQMIACNATISTMLHDAVGGVLNFGRRTRKPPASLRRAARERDRYRCRFPGCQSRHYHVPRRRHYPVHDHPAALRRAPGPALGHLDLLRQRQSRSRPPRTRTSWVLSATGVNRSGVARGG